MITSIRVQQIAVQLLHSAWKRKTILLFVALLSTLLLFAGQLNMRSKRASARDTARTWQKALDPYSHVPAPSPLLFHAPEPVASYPSGRDSLDQTNLRPDTLRQIAQNEAPQSGNLAGLVTQSDGIVRQSEVSKYPSISSSSRFVPDRRIVHFDLKGAPPKIEYIKKLLPLLKKAGANGVLLEYEDMFPYEGNLSVIRAGNAFKKEQLIDLIREFVRHQFEVIPLVQTFGHLEFALKVKQFRRLREIDRFPTAICPSRNESFAQLIQLIIDQVVQLHREANHPIKYLHIGCDEVFHIAQCDRCRNTDRETLFINHVRKVASYVRKVHSLQPIIWDDMLRTMSDDKFPLLGNLVEIMVWTYIKDIYRFIPYMTWKSFGDSFDAVWGASAFKGAFGETLTVPNANMHLENNIGWLDVSHKL